MRTAVQSEAAVLRLARELILRKNERGGRGGKRARSEVQQRLSRWSLGDQEALLAEWDEARKRMAADRARDATTRRAESVGGKHDVRQLRGTCAIGAFGRAMRQLHSHGVADATDPAVVEQLRAKHPQRGELCGDDMSVPRPEEYDQPRAHPPSSTDRIVVPLEALKKRMLGAKPSKGQGPDGMYNEHLWMLGREYSEGTREWQVVDDYRFYAELYLNARLPRWTLKYCHICKPIWLATRMSRRTGFLLHVPPAPHEMAQEGAHRGDARR